MLTAGLVSPKSTRLWLCFKFMMCFLAYVETEYRLVIVCTSENEQRSLIFAGLERYRRPLRDIISPKQVYKYLSERFSGIINQENIESASSLDPQR